ncbi:ScyD/ScyE family protein [Nocardioides sp. SYSU DS0651]|uniref:ScyD/ScyE family protein n=1 Tax=Nocardioides sp. SYSU DS0651 TaxID=3415955 RepID=UPI003F4BB01F
MSLFRPVRALVAAGLTAALAGSVLLPPAHSAAPSRATVAKDLLAPLSVAVSDKGNVYYSENFSGSLWVKQAGKAPKKVHQTAAGENGPAEVGGISIRDNVVYFVSGSRIVRRASDGVKVVANIGKYERDHNPDAGVTYGAVGIDPECAEQFPEESPYPASYPGIVEAHPYATAYGDGALYVADAAANAIFRIKKGKISTVAVLPPATATITEGLAEQLNFPGCSIGAKYRFEGVPTDVEYHNGKLYVSTLPGGPEDGSVAGSVYRMNPTTGNTVRMATGLVSANGLAVADDGNIYVSELFAGRITRITPSGTKRLFTETLFPSAVEVRGSQLFVTERVLVGFGEEEPGGRVSRYGR